LCPLNVIVDYKNRILQTKNATIPIFLDKNEEEYSERTFKINFEEIFSNEINNTNLLDHLDLSHLNSEEKRFTRNLILNNKNVFYKDGDDLTFTNRIKHSINTKHELPVHSKLYRYLEIHKKEVDEQIKEMLKTGIIQNSNSPYNSPIWVVPKKMDNSGK
jgi:hypothetical protein